MMFQCWAILVLACGIASAQDAKTPPGLRVFYTGHSFHMFVPPQVEQLVNEFPGITQQSKLFRDQIGHGQGHVMVLASYCNFATIYRMSPVGLKIQERSVNDEQHAILQKLAWETVTKYPYAGVLMKTE